MIPPSTAVSSIGYTGDGSYRWAWSNQRLDDSGLTWQYVLGSDVAGCHNGGHHYAMEDPYYQGASISRRYNDSTC
jgi:hypothetical protein